MTYSLVTAKDIPTHKLMLKLEDGSFRTFYLTAQEAEWVARNINSMDQFIQLPKTVDANFPSFYPKRGAWMERMPKEEAEARQRRFVGQGVGNVQEDAAKKEREAKVKEWIEGNPEAFDLMKQEAKERLKKGNGMYNIASRGTQKHLERYEAIRAVHLFLSPPSAK